MPAPNETFELRMTASREIEKKPGAPQTRKARAARS
jgi:hypothetical protein